MSIKLGDFEVLTGNLADGQIAVLANFGSDHFEGEASTGLFLHHPRLSSSFNQEGGERFTPTCCRPTQRTQSISAWAVPQKLYGSRIA